MLEIERKFLVSGFPTDLELLREVEIEQGYVSIEPEVRIHRAVDHSNGKTDYRMTLKGNGDLTRTEIKTDIAEKFYYDAVKLLGKPMIQKDYRAYRLGDFILEVCHVDEGLESEFWYAEIEFSSEEEAKGFVPMEYLGEEITYDDRYKMKNYWEKTRK